jgi:hypothetical protein
LTSLAQFMKIERKFQAALVTLRRLFCHGARDHGIQFRRKIGVKRARANRIAVGYFKANGRGTVALKGTVACHHAIQNRAQRKQIGALVDCLSL